MTKITHQVLVGWVPETTNKRNRSDNVKYKGYT